MNISPDIIFDRIETKKQLSRWKLLAVFLAFLAIVLLSDNFKSTAVSSFIARVELEDVLLEDTERDELLSEIAESDNIKALVVHINSPGGTEYAGETIYKSLLKISKVKPVVVVMGTMATSGGYMAALGADYIFAQNSTLTGSIGVLMQTNEITELAKKIGVKFNSFKSTTLKGSPNPYEVVTPEVENMVSETIRDSYNRFVELVSKRRKIDLETCYKIADGRAYTGAQALKLKLVDAIGGEEEAYDFLTKEKQISGKLPVRTLKVRKKIDPLERLFNYFEVKIMAGIENIYQKQQSAVSPVYAIYK